jgi:hypothetical protein
MHTIVGVKDERELQDVVIDHLNALRQQHGYGSRIYCAVVDSAGLAYTVEYSDTSKGFTPRLLANPVGGDIETFDLPANFMWVNCDTFETSILTVVPAEELNKAEAMMPSWNWQV